MSELVNKWLFLQDHCARAARRGLLDPMGMRRNINLHLLPTTSTVYLIVIPLRYVSRLLSLIGTLFLLERSSLYVENRQSLCVFLLVQLINGQMYRFGR